MSAFPQRRNDRHLAGDMFLTLGDMLLSLREGACSMVRSMACAVCFSYGERGQLWLTRSTNAASCS